MTRMTLLVRHGEADKNVRKHFSRDDGSEYLTRRGAQQGIELATHLRDAVLAAAWDGSPVNPSVHAAPASRTYETASSLAAVFGAEVLVHEGLRPISAGHLAGLSEDAAARVAPEFVRRLSLYRAGILNSYDLMDYGESVRDFEARIAEALASIDTTRPDGLRVIVGHRSCLTALLIIAARRSLGYPSNFYGYIPLDVGMISGYVEHQESVSWIGVNFPSNELASRLTDALQGIPK